MKIKHTHKERERASESDHCQFILMDDNNNKLTYQYESKIDMLTLFIFYSLIVFELITDSVKLSFKAKLVDEPLEIGRRKFFFTISC